MATQPQIGNWDTRALHKNLSEGDWDVGSIEEFHTNLQDDKNRRAFYKNLKEDGWEVGEYEDFDERLLAGMLYLQKSITLDIDVR